MNQHPTPPRTPSECAIHSRRTPATRLVRVVVAFGAVAALSACAGGPPPETSRPAWIEMEPSWSRLDAIERWLDTGGTRDDANLRIEAELQLAEGRLDFAESDRLRNPNARVENRVEAAREGLQRTLRSSVTNASQRRRAEAALARAAALDQLLPSRPGPAAADAGPVGALPRSRWRPRTADTSDMARASGRWTALTVHHTNMEHVAAPRPGAGEAANASYMRELQRAHQVHRGWADVGYQFVIDADGRLWEGRSLDWVGAHAGRSGTTNNNEENIGISLMGNFQSRAPSSAALAALTRTLDSFRARFGIARSRVYGHREFRNTACPGDVLMDWVRRYRGGAAASPSNRTPRGTRGAKPTISSLDGSPTTRSTSEPSALEALLFGDASAGSSSAR